MQQITLSWNDPVTESQLQYNGILPFTIGRGLDNALVLNNANVSRNHTELILVDEQIFLVDLKSSNGTWYRGESITRIPIEVDDLFEIGPFTLTVTAILNAESSADMTEHTSIQVRWREPDGAQLQMQDVVLPVIIGRSRENQIVLAGEGVSRQHLRIEQRGNELWVVDLDSANGIRVSGKKVVEAPLAAGNQIEVDVYRLEVHNPAWTTHTARAVADVGTILIRDAVDVAALPTIQRIKITEFPPSFFDAKQVAIADLKRTDVPVHEKTYLAIGGGLGSFTWIDHLLIYGVDPSQVAVLGLNPKPHSRYQQLCQNSQIPDHERLRSNSDSCPDNIWGWPGYAVREIWHCAKSGNVGQALQVAWQIFGEPTLAETYTPIAGKVFASIEREARRIGWEQLWHLGRVEAIRQTDDGRYVAAYTQGDSTNPHSYGFFVADFIHVAIGYPGIRFLNDLSDYRQRTGDDQRVVNAYESHNHVYQHLRQHGGTVLVRGRGIVASRIIQRLYEMRGHNPRIKILHLMRTPKVKGYQYRQARRDVAEHWEYQPFNWPKACWGGDLQQDLEGASPLEQDDLLNSWGGTTTASRQDWQQIIKLGLEEGWYQREIGAVSKVDLDTVRNKIQTHINSKNSMDWGITKQTRLDADFVIDATGLESSLDTHPLLQDLVEFYGLERNPKGRLHVANSFEIEGMRSHNGNHTQAGRMYASGVMTLGGPYAPVDSFLGLQFAAQRSMDDLISTGAPGLQPLTISRSLDQWLRWAKGEQP